MNEEVIVGTGLGGQGNIVETLRRNGFGVLTTDAGWPRDHYVLFQNRYVRSGAPGWCEGNVFGEGGEVLTGDDFLLVGDLACQQDNISKKIPNRRDYEQVKRAIISEGEKYWPKVRTHVAPTGYFHGGKGHGHIDMFALLLPQSKILVLDTHFGKGAGRAQEYDAIAELEGLRLIRYDGSQDGVWYPLNSLNLSNDGKDIVLIDNKAKSLATLLRGEGVEVLETAMPQHEYPAGKIRCQTNTYRIGDNINSLL